MSGKSWWPRRTAGQKGKSGHRAGPVADAFFVAFRIPNLFRRLVGEGAKMSYRPYWASCPNACLASCPNACLASCHNSSSRVSEV